MFIPVDLTRVELTCCLDPFSFPCLFFFLCDESKAPGWSRRRRRRHGTQEEATVGKRVGRQAGSALGGGKKECRRTEGHDGVGNKQELGSDRRNEDQEEENENKGIAFTHDDDDEPTKQKNKSPPPPFSRRASSSSSRLIFSPSPLPTVQQQKKERKKERKRKDKFHVPQSKETKTKKPRRHSSFTVRYQGAHKKLCCVCACLPLNSSKALSININTQMTKRKRQLSIGRVVEEKRIPFMDRDRWSKGQHLFIHSFIQETYFREKTIDFAIWLNLKSNQRAAISHPIQRIKELDSKSRKMFLYLMQRRPLCGLTASLHYYFATVLEKALLSPPTHGTVFILFFAPDSLFFACHCLLLLCVRVRARSWVRSWLDGTCCTLSNAMRRLESTSTPAGGRAFSETETERKFNDLFI